MKETIKEKRKEIMRESMADFCNVTRNMICGGSVTIVKTGK